MLSLALTIASFALVGAITPGPVNVLALRHGSQGPRRVALLYVLGASLSYMLVVWCMGLGARQLLHWLPRLASSAQWLCAAYLLWLAWCLARAPVPAQQPSSTPGALATHSRPTPQHPPRAAARAFMQGVAVQTLNPKAWLFALSAVSLFVLPQSPAPNAALYLLCGISLLACLLGVGCWACLGRVLARWIRTPRQQKNLNLVLAALLMTSIFAMLA